jgi:hypothetical protein
VGTPIGGAPGQQNGSAPWCDKRGAEPKTTAATEDASSVTTADQRELYTRFAALTLRALTVATESRIMEFRIDPEEPSGQPSKEGPTPQSPESGKHDGQDPPQTGKTDESAVSDWVWEGNPNCGD